MKFRGIGWMIYIILMSWGYGLAAESPVSDATQECLDCHTMIHPGIVADWRQSRHAEQTVEAAQTLSDAARRVSTDNIPPKYKKNVVGCAECHLARPESHAATFDHNGHPVHTVVSPDDCAVCHNTETKQYRQNIMAHAHGNLADNPVYQQLQSAIIDIPHLAQNEDVSSIPAKAPIEAQACYFCHGTQVTTAGMETRDTELGEMEFPVLKGWPNQGVGRINGDGSKGACSACHTRHAFSIAVARKPGTCKSCHVGPDVPAAKVYDASKHGNIYASMKDKWDFETVPWTIGRDFTAPTCAACHISLLVDGDGEVITQRTHQMNDRLSHRLYGLIYAHAHPKNPDTTLIRNADGLPLPTSFNAQPAADFLVSQNQATARLHTMQRSCRQCHAASWVQTHFKRLESTISETNARIKTATQLMQAIWREGWAQGVPQQANLFDEAVEKKWTRTWLFQANSIRFAAAMAGGGDYGVFADGRYQLAEAIAEMMDWMELQARLQEKAYAEPHAPKQTIPPIARP